MKSNEILHGPALDQLKTLDSESVDCCITSPPYWALRDYKTEGQIWDAVNGCEHVWDITNVIQSGKGKGHAKSTLSITHGNSEKSKGYYDNNTQFNTITNFCSKCNAWKGSLGLEPTFQLYIKHLVDIFSQVKRVLKKEGSCWVNMGDTYSGSGTRGGQGYEDSKDITERRYYNSTGQIPEKSLCLIPQRFQIAMVDEGWICRNTIIWYKPNCMPSSAKDRFTVDFEYLFFFTKSQRYYFETQYEMMARPYDDKTFGRGSQKWIDATKYDPHEKRHDRYHGDLSANVNPLGRLKRCVWKIATQPFSEAHFATFPPALVKTPLLATCPEYVCQKCGKAREKIIEPTGNMITDGYGIPREKENINDWSATSSILTKQRKEYKETGLTDCGCNAGFNGGVCLDPFMGAGTVALVALQNARNFIGCELNQAYIDMALKRLEPYLLQTRLPI